jgi:hypothetical protein
MGLLADPHCGSGPMMPQEVQAKDVNRVIAPHSGSTLLMGLLLRSKCVRRLHPITEVGSGPMMELRVNRRSVSGVDEAH